MTSAPFKAFDVVVLRRGIPDEGIAPGTRGVILEVHSSPKLAYEVEVADDATGETQWWGSVNHEDLEAADEG